MSRIWLRTAPHGTSSNDMYNCCAFDLELMDYGQRVAYNKADGLTLWTVHGVVYLYIFWLRPCFLAPKVIQ